MAALENQEPRKHGIREQTEGGRKEKEEETQLSPLFQALEGNPSHYHLGSTSVLLSF